MILPWGKPFNNSGDQWKSRRQKSSYELNKKYKRIENGIELGFGLPTVYVKLEVGDLTALVDIIYCATRNSKYKPTEAQIETFIDECPDIDGLIAEIYDELSESNATKKALATLRESQESPK